MKVSKEKRQEIAKWAQKQFANTNVVGTCHHGLASLAEYFGVGPRTLGNALKTELDRLASLPKRERKARQAWLEAAANKA